MSRHAGALAIPEASFGSCNDEPPKDQKACVEPARGRAGGPSAAAEFDSLVSPDEVLSREDIVRLQELHLMRARLFAHDFRAVRHFRFPHSPIVARRLDGFWSARSAGPSDDPLRATHAGSARLTRSARDMRGTVSRSRRRWRRKTEPKNARSGVEPARTFGKPVFTRELLWRHETTPPRCRSEPEPAGFVDHLRVSLADSSCNRQPEFPNTLLKPRCGAPLAPAPRARWSGGASALAIQLLPGCTQPWCPHSAGE